MLFCQVFKAAKQAKAQCKGTGSNICCAIFNDDYDDGGDDDDDGDGDDGDDDACAYVCGTATGCAI